jgi:uncharacterized protein involved in exopolysaccharide biosynthesis
MNRRFLILLVAVLVCLGAAFAVLMLMPMKEG